MERKPLGAKGQRKRFLFSVVGGTVLLLAGIWLGHRFASGNGPPPGVNSSDPKNDEHQVQNGVPTGYENNEEGALEAATNFARVMTGVPGDFYEYREAMRTLAAPNWVSRAEELATNGIHFLLERYGEGGDVVFLPVRYRIVRFSSSEATVELWGVTLASGPKVSGIEESWITGTVELVWTSGDWRVIGQDARTGPTPDLVQAADTLTADALTDFEEFNAPIP